MTHTVLQLLNIGHNHYNSNNISHCEKFTGESPVCMLLLNPDDAHVQNDHFVVKMTYLLHSFDSKCEFPEHSVWQKVRFVESPSCKLRPPESSAPGMLT
jgi:hypothetical protein